jgi:Uma2 family endonuclease
MTAAAPSRFTEDEYLERERRSETKHELIHGEIVAMSGATLKHNAIAANVITALKARLKGRGCFVLGSDQRVHVAASGLYTYPDVTVVCDKPKFHPKDKDTLLNPRVLIEILSSSTEAYDRGAKFAHYRSILSLEEYVLVAQNGQRVECFRRIEAGEWLLTLREGDGAVLPLRGLGCEIPLAEIYEDTALLDEAAAD